MDTPDSSSSFSQFFRFFPIIFGVLIIIISYCIHFATIDYGTSGTNYVGTKLNNTIWPLLSGLIIILIGFVYWIWAGFNTEYRFFGLFILCLLSLLSCNAALYFSLIQVTVTPR